MVWAEKDGSTEELVRARTGPGEPSVARTRLSSFPAAVACRGAGRAALMGRSNEGALPLKALSQVRRQLSLAVTAGGQEE